MDQPNYSLRLQIPAHSNDVRSVSVTGSTIVSASRDMCVKVWTEHSGQYELSGIHKGHRKYISSVCVIPPSRNFQNGLIASGAHDHKIYGFIPNVEEPLVCLIGHSGTVCSLYSSPKGDILYSSSWDCTAKIWNICQQECIFTIYGHTQTVWAIIYIPLDYVITGSADKTIKVFTAQGNFVNTLSGHTDCVRGLSYLYESFIVSCGNDGTIRTWNVNTAECLSVQQLHQHYIYSIKAAYDQNIIALGCEEKILSLIINGNQQDIVLPAQSIWAVNILPNSDIVTGSSDGYIRIFTACPSRKASAEELKIFQEQVNNPDLLQPEPLISVKSLKNSEKVTDEGKFNGQLKFLKLLGSIKCFKWSASTKKWLPIGDKNKSPESEAKKFESQDYDVIFYIDVENNIESPLPLPYSFEDDDPLIVTEKFVEEHKIDSKFYRKLLHFLANAKKETQKSANRYYPPNNFIFIRKCAIEDVVKNRLVIYWEQQSMSLADPALECIKSLLSLDNVLDDQSIRSAIQGIIKCLETWPESLIYPIFDIARISLLNPRVSSILFNEGYITKFWDATKAYMLRGCSVINQMFVCRILCNMFSSEDGINFIFENKELIFSCLPMSSFSEHSRGSEVAISTLLINISMEAIKRNDSIAIYACLWLVQHLLMVEKDEEAIFRTLVAFGTLSLFVKIDMATIGKDVYLKLKDIITWRYCPDAIKAAKCGKLLLRDLVSIVLESGIPDEDMDSEE